jgi:hypothetical protein
MTRSRDLERLALEHARQRIRELEEENAALKTRLGRRADTDPWEAPLRAWLVEQEPDWRHSTEALLRVVGGQPGHRLSEIRIRAIMVKLGWKPGLVPAPQRGWPDRRVKGYVHEAG